MTAAGEVQMPSLCHALFSENVPVAIVMFVCYVDMYDLLFHLIFSLGP